MNKRLTTALLLVLVLVACGEERHAPTIAEALDQITQEGINAHLSYLADDALEGRMTGEKGYFVAAEYVAEQFAALGLGPGGDGGWYQAVPLQCYMIDPGSATMIVHKDGVDTELEFLEQFAMRGDAVRPETSVRAEVVYIGYGVHAPAYGYSDYDGVDVEGKILAGFSGGPDTIPSDERAYYSSGRVKSREAVSRGAVGWISLRSRHSQESFPWERIKAVVGKKPGMSWVDKSGAVADFFPELVGSAYLSAAAASKIMADAPISFEQALDAADASTPSSADLGFEVTLSRRTTLEQLQSPNVIGIIRGSDPELADEYVVFSAHLDHVGIGEPVAGSDDRIYNGAYDNAMGVALMLEAGRALVQNPPRRSIMLIALTGEERGLLGSDYFAHYPTVPKGSLVANVNLDMPLFLYPVADLIGFGSEHSSLLAPMQAAAEAEGFVLTPDPMPEENLFRRSDQYSFVRQGIPASYLDPGFGSTDPAIDGEAIARDHYKNHYHKPSDDLSRPVDWDSAVRFSRANARIGFAVGNAETRPAWNEGDFFGEKFGR